jgi:hypothetical protein
MPRKVKLLMSWDIESEQETTTLEFMAHELAPAIQQLGMSPTEAWYTVYGQRPQILVGVVANDLATMRRVLSSDKWRELQEKLAGHARNYQQKMVWAEGRFQL